MRYLLIVLMLVSGCAGAKYREYDAFSGKGYQESKVTDDRYSVMFQGDGFNTPLEVKTLFLKRCSDIALDNGFSYFEIISETPGVKMNGPMSWPSHSGEIKLLKVKTEKSIEAKRG